MADWRVARSLNVMLEQINDAYPDRLKVSDGSIGDTAHAPRTSDHNPDLRGVVRARDFTHDPEHGFDAGAFAERLRINRDPRIKYVISNGRLFSSLIQPWQWRPYTGVNQHAKHVHVSVVGDDRGDDQTSWAGITDNDEEEDDMTPDQDQVLRDAYNAAVQARSIAGDARAAAQATAAQITSLSAAVKALAEAFAKQPQQIQDAVAKGIASSVQVTGTLNVQPKG